MNCENILTTTSEISIFTLVEANNILKKLGATAVGKRLSGIIKSSLFALEFNPSSPEGKHCAVANIIDLVVLVVYAVISALLVCWNPDLQVLKNPIAGQIFRASLVFLLNLMIFIRYIIDYYRQHIDYIESIDASGARRQSVFTFFMLLVIANIVIAGIASFFVIISRNDSVRLIKGFSFLVIGVTFINGLIEIALNTFGAKPRICDS